MVFGVMGFTRINRLSTMLDTLFLSGTMSLAGMLKKGMLTLRILMLFWVVRVYLL